MDVARKRKPDFADQLMDALEGQGPFTQELAWAAADRIRELERDLTRAMEELAHSLKT